MAHILQSQSAPDGILALAPALGATFPFGSHGGSVQTRTPLAPPASVAHLASPSAAPSSPGHVPSPADLGGGSALMRMEPGLSRDSAPRTSGSTASAPRSFTSQNDSTVVRTPSASRTRTWSICLTRPGTSTGMATNTSPSRENAALAICSTVSAGMR
eukprot:CAMPEP_0198704390 /NCGR_PEP_ID=MMETSP1468-20131203/389864_1 /TAXON_ID=1461545 /ORGANISM="Mantoniella sp, Strain CCMP1436" /LENGTH=157 /DNA_ID=CAMNT_0044463203 /DNA_START=910 /DNA_END=1381 /DNA_ORIENTATION=-